MNLQHLSIASVPIQSWGPIYDGALALKKGTIFQDLDMPFFAANDTETTNRCCEPSNASDPKQQEREAMMLQIYQVSFEADDLRLYLDTHPQDAQALELLKNRLMQRRQLLKNFAQQFYALTMDCMADCEQMQDKTGCYCWQEGPMPWEGACV